MCEESLARLVDVFVGESLGECRVASGHGVKDALVLTGDIRGGSKVVGLYLSDAEFDLAHEQRVHANEAGARLSGDE
jgi:hypothetical protein